MNTILLINRFGPGHFIYHNESIFDFPENIVLINHESIALPVDAKKFRAVELCNLSEEASVLKLTKALHEQYQFTKVVALSEFDVMLAANVRDILNLEGMGIRQAHRFINKLTMKDKLKEESLCVPEYRVLSSLGEAKQFLSRYKKVVIKPIDGSGSIDTYIVDNQVQLEQIYNNIINSEKTFEIEEFIDGDMYHCDAVLQNRQLKLFSPSRYVAPTTNFGESNFNGSVSETDVKKVSDLKHYTMRCLEALEAENGLYHLECFITPKGEIVFCEVAARIPGAGVRPSIREAYNADITKLLIDLNINDQEIEEFEMKSHFGQIILFNLKDWSKIQRKYKEIDEPWIEFKQFLVSEQSIASTAKSSSDAAIKYVFFGQNNSELVDRLSHLANQYNHL